MNKFFGMIRAERLTILCIVIVCTMISLFITGFDRFPDEVRLSSGSTKHVQTGLPVRASVSVYDQDAVPVLKLGGQPVSENIQIDVSDGLELVANDSGRASVSLNMFGLPGRRISLDVLPNLELVACGTTVGVRVETDGVLVIGTGEIVEDSARIQSPSSSVLRSGDMILKADGVAVQNKEHFAQLVNAAGEELRLSVRRRDDTLELSINPHKSPNGERKIGAWIRDDTKGIGTITYYDPRTNRFAALGHGIVDVDTKQMMHIRSGHIMHTDIVDVVKGKRGAPGELVGRVREGRILGTIDKNTSHGIFGSLNYGEKAALPSEKLPISLQSQVYVGPAVIRSSVGTDSVKEYDIFIEAVNKFSQDDTRGMVIRITDPELLRRTNGIVQGMSGSPILQDGRLVGAVTHVFVQDPSKGYGIFIESMLAQNKTQERP